MTGRRLLVVDDDPVVRELAVLAIGRTPGWHALVATSGAEALAVVARERPDVVLLDVRMPGMDGPEVVQALRAGARTRQVPVILLTATDREGELARLRALPVSGVVRKPFRPDSLAGSIRDLLGWAA